MEGYPPTDSEHHNSCYHSIGNYQLHGGHALKMKMGYLRKHLPHSFILESENRLVYNISLAIQAHASASARA